MFCSNCGKQLPDQTKFCTGCGTPVGVAPEVSHAEPVVTAAPKAPKVPKSQKAPKKLNPLVIILPVAGVALIAVVALVIALFAGAFTGDAGKVFNALEKSAQAYTDAQLEVAFPEFATEDEDIVASQSMSLWINDLPQMTELEGMGIQLDTDTNIPGRELQTTVTARYGAADIVSAQILMQDAELYVDVPQLTGGRPFMINTEELGQTLAYYGVEDEGIENLGFNIFNLIQIVNEYTATEETELELPKEVVKEFVKAIEVEKLGKEEADINDHDLKCTVYEVVIPEDALCDLLEAYIDLLPEADPNVAIDVVLAIYDELGVPDYLYDEFLDEVDNMSIPDDPMDEAYDAMEEVLEIIGDIKLDVFLHKGYVVSVVYEETIEDVDMEITVDLGGGDNYVDDLSIEAVIDEAEIRLISTGNHACKGGIYTDSTTVEFDDPYSYTVTITSELTYEPDAKDENFSWVVDCDDAFKFEILGQITTGKDEAIIRIEELDLQADGEKIINIGMELSVRQYAGVSMDTGNAIDIGSLTMDELYEEVMSMEETAMTWVLGLEEAYPELIEILNDMM